jgi:hypothetical protein
MMEFRNCADGPMASARSRHTAHLLALLSVIAGFACQSWLSDSAAAAVIGSNLLHPANASVCEFQALEPKSNICTVGQVSLSPDHTAPDGLLAPIDGIVVRWSVVSGQPLPGTGSVKLALRTMGGPGALEKGPEVDLPLSGPGTRYAFAERMPVSAGQRVGVKITVTNQNHEEAGAPIAFAESGVGRTESWDGEPMSSIWDTEEDTELLLDAEIEPDQDHDGYGDVTQDCFPNHPGDQGLCGKDLSAPVIRPRFAARQAFLKSGVVMVRVGSNESGLARVSGRLQIKGRGGRTYALRGARKPIAAEGIAALRLQIPKPALKAAKAASRTGKKILVTARVGVMDSARNTREATIRIRPKAMR